jgi:hypothetical protein
MSTEKSKKEKDIARARAHYEARAYPTKDEWRDLLEKL